MFEFYQESRGQAGPNYAYEAGYGNVLCGWPERMSIKALKETVKIVNSDTLTMTRKGKSPVFCLEGPVDEVKRVLATALEWRLDRVRRGKS